MVLKEFLNFMMLVRNTESLARLEFNKVTRWEVHFLLWPSIQS